MEKAYAVVCGAYQLGPKLHGRVNEWVIIGPLWYVIVSTIQKGQMHISSMLSLFTSLQNHSIQI